jgi:hypothetical protein
LGIVNSTHAWAGNSKKIRIRVTSEANGAIAFSQPTVFEIVLVFVVTLGRIKPKAIKMIRASL